MVIYIHTHDSGVNEEFHEHHVPYYPGRWLSVSSFDAVKLDKWSDQEPTRGTANDQLLMNACKWSDRRGNQINNRIPATAHCTLNVVAGAR